MATVDGVEVSSAPATVEAPVEPKPAEEKPVANEKKPRGAKATKEKKPKAPKPPAPSHPPYFEMIKEAIVALNERTGSSTYAIAKQMEEKHKGELPANYKKVLATQLKNFTAKGKLVKVKASFKLSESGKDEKKKPVENKQPAKDRKPKAAASAPAAKRKRSAAAPKKSAPKPKKAKKAAPPKPKQPKSIKSPAAKRARRATA